MIWSGWSMASKNLKQFENFPKKTNKFDTSKQKRQSLDQKLVVFVIEGSNLFVLLESFEVLEIVNWKGHLKVPDCSEKDIVINNMFYFCKFYYSFIKKWNRMVNSTMIIRSIENCKQFEIFPKKRKDSNLQKQKRPNFYLNVPFGPSFVAFVFEGLSLFVSVGKFRIAWNCKLYCWLTVKMSSSQ